MKISKYAIMLSMSASVLATSAMAYDNRDVVRDSNKNIIKNTFDNCVRTKWESQNDECGNTQPAPAPYVESVKKPIKRSRSYIVFFDFDKSSLTPNALEIIKKANEEARSSNQHPSFSITGHADRSGTDAYNLKLSQRRAASVKAELTKLGVEKGNVESAAKGESEPLVPTEDGVKEPQNRRVEINYNIEE